MVMQGIPFLITVEENSAHSIETMMKSPGQAVLTSMREPGGKHFLIVYSSNKQRCHFRTYRN
jgi:hypothetical protein